jgi:predicted anti-sigma-YlaC factor YlaD
MSTLSRSLRRVMPTCEEATRIASSRLDDTASLVQKARLAMHLAICVWCRRYVRQIAFLRRVMRRLAEPPAGLGSTALPAEASERAKAALRADPAFPRGPGRP